MCVEYKMYDKLWRSALYNKVSAKNRVQDIRFNLLKFKVNDTYRRDLKITTNFEPSNLEDIINKEYSDTKFAEWKYHISYIEKEYKEYKLHNKKQSKEDELIGRAVKTTIQILHDKGSFYKYDNVDEVTKDLFTCWKT